MIEIYLHDKLLNDKPYLTVDYKPPMNCSVDEYIKKNSDYMGGVMYKIEYNYGGTHFKYTTVNFDLANCLLAGPTSLFESTGSIIELEVFGGHIEMIKPNMTISRYVHYPPTPIFPFPRVLSLCIDVYDGLQMIHDSVVSLTVRQYIDGNAIKVPRVCILHIDDYTYNGVNCEPDLSRFPTIKYLIVKGNILVQEDTTPGWS